MTQQPVPEHSPRAQPPRADPDGSGSPGREARPTDVERPVRGEFIEGEGTPAAPASGRTGDKTANEARGGEGDEDATSQ